MILFVYGTLKKGFPNHHLLGGSFRVTGLTPTNIHGRLVDLTHFPGLILDERGPHNMIWGEYYEVSKEDLEAIDFLEGHPNYYKRVAFYSEEIKAEAQTYVLPYDDYCEYPPVDNNCWGEAPPEVREESKPHSEFIQGVAQTLVRVPKPNVDFDELNRWLDNFKVVAVDPERD